MDSDCLAVFVSTSCLPGDFLAGDPKSHNAILTRAIQDH